MGNIDSYVRHELRTALNQIHGFSDLLREDLASVGLSDELPVLTKILDQSQSLKRLIDKFFGKDSDAVSRKGVLAVKEQFQVLLYDIAGEVQGLKESLEEQGHTSFLADLDRILMGTSHMVELLDRFLGRFEMDELASEFGRSEGAGLSDLSTQTLQEDEVVWREGIVFVIDDEESSRELLSRQLQKMGYSVVTAETGTEALNRLPSVNPDLIILDIMMPGLNGFRVLETLKQDEFSKDIPVIIMSALDDMKSIVHCIEMGAEDYLLKDFDPILLKARVNASIEKKRMRDKERAYINTIVSSQQVLDSELAEAAEYVRSLLPEPISESIESRYVFIPSKRLGGDCFGFHWMDDDNLALYLLDVSGHGVGAALLSVSVMNLMRTQSLRHTNFHDPSRVLSALNRAFEMDESSPMFIALWYGVYNRQSRILTYAAAGSPPAVLVESGEEEESWEDKRLCTEGPVIGVDADAEFLNAEIKVHSKSRLYLFSDGIYEARRPNGTMVGYEDFVTILKAHRAAGKVDPQDLVRQVSGLSSDSAFADDVSLLQFDFF